MKKFIVGVVTILGLCYLIDCSTNESTKQIYALDLICASEAGSEVLKKEASRMEKILIERSVSLNENDFISETNHWLRIYEVSSYKELIKKPNFIFTCEYNACIYEGSEPEICIGEKVESCLEYGVSYNECF